VSDAAQAGNIPESLEPPKSLDVRFLLSEHELKEAFAALHPLITNRRFKAVGRVINGLAAVFYLGLPHLVGQSWRQFLQTQPVEAVFLAVLALVTGWTATGSIGNKAIDRFLNRLDLERSMVLDDRGVRISRGGRNWNYAWRRLTFFHETPELFILQTAGISFWIIPKRVFDAQGEREFRDFLIAKLPRRGKFFFQPRPAPSSL
jgi:YcxB-like protein